MKRLAVFDFDHTIIDDNSDTAVVKLKVSEISNDVHQLYKKEGWTAYMQAIFKVLHQDNISERQITDLIKGIPAVQGMENLLMDLHDNLNYDIIIVSDSNTYFINTWLKYKNLDLKIAKIFSNPAEFDAEGLLNIKMFHYQDSCPLSTQNLCKGSIVEDFIKTQSENNINYEFIVYVGDGYNDLCPILRLKENDIACVRNQYKCAEIVTKAVNGHFTEAGVDYTLKSKVCIWNSGEEILNFIKVF